MKVRTQEEYQSLTMLMLFLHLKKSIIQRKLKGFKFQASKELA